MSIARYSVEVQAVETLYRMILESVIELADGALIFSPEKEGFARARARLLRVKELSISAAPVEEDEAWLTENLPEVAEFLHQSGFSSFAGPGHLAALLLPCVDFIREAAVIYTPPPDGSNGKGWNEGLKVIASSRPYLWSNHRQAIGSGFLNNGMSTTCSFPTGAGKSTLSELRILATLTAGGSVIFVAPTNALVSQTQKALAQTLPDFDVEKSMVAEDSYAEVGELVANVGVMTPERCLLTARLSPERFANVGLIVFDECHLLHGPKEDTNRRGLDAMLALLYLFTICKGADWLFLSAMMSNAAEMAEWIGDVTGRPCLPLTLDWKPTRQARGCLVYDGDSLHSSDAQVAAGKEAVLELRPQAFVSLRQTWAQAKADDYSAISLTDQTVPIRAQRLLWGGIRYDHRKNEIAPLIAAGFAKSGMKVLIFAHSKTDVGAIAVRAGDQLKGIKKAGEKLTQEETELLKTVASEVGDLTHSFVKLDSLAGPHHSLLLPSEREFVEARFRNPDGFQVLAATATLAQGMNLPADAVIIVGGERYDVKNKQQAKIAAHDLLNAAGRAGRAGHVSQGFVLFIPQKVVGLYMKDSKIDKEWFRIQSDIFELSDQCLAISDPIQSLLDEIQVRGIERPEAAYFLRRLPAFSDNGEDTAPAFLARSFGAFESRKRGDYPNYTAKVNAALSLREAALRDPAEFTWHAEVATRNGVPIELIQALAAFLGEIDVAVDCFELARRIFSWLFADPDRMKPVFSDRLVQRYGAEMEGDLFGPKILHAIFRWMEGGNLKCIQALRTGRNEKYLNSARKFVLQAIPELSFGIGLAAQTYRAGIENGVFARMPLTLALVSQCLREGLPTPEILALSYLMQERQVSRADVIGEWEAISAKVKPGDPYEEFKMTIRRVAAARKE